MDKNDNASVEKSPPNKKPRVAAMNPSASSNAAQVAIGAMPWNEMEEAGPNGKNGLNNKGIEAPSVTSSNLENLSNGNLDSFLASITTAEQLEQLPPDVKLALIQLTAQQIGIDCDASNGDAAAATPLGGGGAATSGEARMNPLLGDPSTVETSIPSPAFAAAPAVDAAGVHPAAVAVAAGVPDTGSASIRRKLVDQAPVEAPDPNDKTPVKELIRKWPSLLMRLMSEAEDDEWEEVYQRILSHPNEIAIQGRNGGMHALHAACVRYPPVRIVRALLEANADIALVPNFSGETALHLASYSASEEVQQLVIRAAPKAATIPDQYGDLPLHFAARNGATLGLMEELIRAAPETISKANQRGVTPFWLLPRSYLEAESLEEILLEDDEDDDYDDDDAYLDDFMLLVLFLKYSYFGGAASTMKESFGVEPDDYAKWMVHAAASTPSCPREVLRFLCRLFPQASLEYDHNGFTPLLCSVQTEEMEDPKAWDEAEDGFREPVEAVEVELQDAAGDQPVPAETTALHVGDSDFIEHVVKNAQPDEHDSEAAVDILLEWSPRSIVKVDRAGRMPLTHALLSGRSWKVILKLIAACPRALEQRDATTGFYMFQIAAMHCDDLDTIFTTVRGLPQLLAMARGANAAPP